MEFGMPTLLELEGVRECARLCGELGLHFVELNMNLPQNQPEAVDPRLLRKLAREEGIYFTIHLDENLNPCDFNPRVARAYRETALAAIRLAGELGCPVLNMHMAQGVYFTLPGERRYLFSQYLADYLERLGQFRDACVREAGEIPLRICIENTGGFDTDFLQQGLDLLLESSLFALTFDVGHNAAAGGIDEARILKRRDRLVHMHLHDAAKGADHLPLGTGGLDLDACLELAEERGCRVVLETKTVEALRDSVAYLKAGHWRTFFRQA